MYKASLSALPKRASCWYCYKNLVYTIIEQLFCGCNPGRSPETQPLGGLLTLWSHVLCPALQLRKEGPFKIEEKSMQHATSLGVNFQPYRPAVDLILTCLSSFAAAQRRITVTLAAGLTCCRSRMRTAQGDAHVNFRFRINTWTRRKRARMTSRATYRLSSPAYQVCFKFCWLVCLFLCLGMNGTRNGSTFVVIGWNTCSLSIKRE